MENSKKVIINIAYFLFLFFLIGCVKKKSIKEQNPINKNSQIYVQIKDILYKDSKGNLYFKTVSHGDISEGIRSEDIYIDEITYNTGKIEKLRNIIDTVSFRRLNYIYYKDNDHVFVEIPMAYGSNFGIVNNADSKTFKSLGDSYYAIDNKNCYYKGNSINKAENKSFKILKQKDGNENTAYARDNNVYYTEGKPISHSKIKEYIVE